MSRQEVCFVIGVGVISLIAGFGFGTFLLNL